MNKMYNVGAGAGGLADATKHAEEWLAGTDPAYQRTSVAELAKFLMNGPQL